MRDSLELLEKLDILASETGGDGPAWWFRVELLRRWVRHRAEA